MKPHRKTLIILILATVLVLCFGACENKNSESQSQSEPVAPVEEPQEEIEEPLEESQEEITKATEESNDQISEFEEESHGQTSESEEESQEQAIDSKETLEEKISEPTVDSKEPSFPSTKYYNSAEGYTLSFPEGTSFDESLAKYIITATGESFTCTISCERSPYKNCTSEMTEGLKNYVPDFSYEDGIDQYIGYYQSRFILNEQWQSENDVVVSKPEIFYPAGHKAYIFNAVVEDTPSDSFDAYTFAYIKTGGQYFMRLVFKYDSSNEVFKDQIKEICSSLELSEAKGGAKVTAKYSPILPTTWSAETQQLYKKIVNSDSVSWGIFTSDITRKGINETVPALEESLDYEFDVILAYVHSCSEFPSDFMTQCWNEGKIVELTYQITNNNNTDFLVDSPLLDIYRGENTESIRAFARAAKEFGHPFLLRICNEMNSDWTSYGGVANLCDPSVYIQVWRTMYEIFEEEGVDNCIWVFNPNDRSAPPSKWNNALCYYPGDEYVQIIGVTGYNNGNYYAKWSETWREFKDIYDQIEKEYGVVFGDFPWMITEFASSSYGGDKAKWIESMFENIRDYDNIKIAVWFSSADYTSDGVAARPYWLDETPETLEAFRKGLSDFTSGLLR